MNLILTMSDKEIKAYADSLTPEQKERAMKILIDAAPKVVKTINQFGCSVEQAGNAFLEFGKLTEEK